MSIVALWALGACTPTSVASGGDGDADRSVDPPRRGRLARWSDAGRFAIEWLRHPLATAAVAPSGPWLAALIVREIDAATGPVLELGPGTGVFTRALIERGVAERDLTLIERNPAFADLLRRRHPAATIHVGDAAEPVAVHRFGAIVCGLGLRNMPEALVERIVEAAFAQLRPGGGLYLFTYGGRCSVSPAILERLGLTAERVGRVLRNLPPASVYRLRAVPAASDQTAG